MFRETSRVGGLSISVPAVGGGGGSAGAVSRSSLLSLLPQAPSIAAEPINTNNLNQLNIALDPLACVHLMHERGTWIVQSRTFVRRSLEMPMSAPNSPTAWAEDVLRFWFTELRPEDWFNGA